MCDVTKSNFEELFPRIESAIQASSFVAFDGEFTCLTASNSGNPSLVDTPELRYGKLKKNVSQSTLCQIGISTFIADKEKENSYCVKSFNFYLFPHSFGPLDSRFLCQPSSIEFLCHQNFDFNKFLYDGVPYLNLDQERVLREMHANGNIRKACSAMSVRILDGENENRLFDEIYTWKLNANIGETKIVAFPVQAIDQYVMLFDLRERIPDISCRYTTDGELEITKQDGEHDSQLIENSYDQEFEKIIQSQIGFSRVLRVITENKKPVVGHNCLTDLLYIFDKFYKTLPESYKTFKSELHKVLPKIYDTKHISMMLRRTMRKVAIFDETKLEDLHEMLSSNQGLFYVLHSPRIKHGTGFERYHESEYLHEAGYDAYLTGYVFIRMAHFLAAKDIKSDDMKPSRFKELVEAVRDFKNCANLSRAATRFVNIEGDDPRIELPERFVVTMKRNKKKALSSMEIAHEFLPFGSVDVQLENANRAVVAVSHRKRAKDIVEAFKRHKTYSVAPLNSGLPSNAMKYCAASLTILGIGGGIGCFLMLRR